MIQSEYLTTKETAEKLSLSEITIKRYIKSGVLKSIKYRSKRLINRNELEKFIKINSAKKRTISYPPKRLHFYWSQKAISSASDIYNKYCKKGDIIMDPFLGGGSSLYATNKKNMKFIGIEINEMPIKISQFYLKPNLNKRIEDIANTFSKIKRKMISHYEYTYNNKRLVFKKCIYDLIDNKIKVKQIHFKSSDGKIKDYSNNKKLINEYLSKNNDYKKKINPVKKMELIKNSRIAIKDGMHIFDIFSPINFSLLTQIKNSTNKNDDFKFLLSCSLHLCRLTDTKSQSQFPYWVPKKDILDRNIFDLLENKLKILNKMDTKNFDISQSNDFKQLLNKNNSSGLLINKPIQNIDENDIPDDTVDFVLTDPPYFDQIAYSEYLKIWEYFLGYKSNLKDEIIVSNRKQHSSDEGNYYSKLELAFKIIFKKMKNNATMVMYFKESRKDKLLKILEIMNNIGFQFLDQEYISSNVFTYKQNTTKKTTLVGDCIFVFNKKNSKTVTEKKDTSLESIQEIIEEFSSTYLKINNKASFSEILYNGLLKKLYFNNGLKYFKKIKQLTNILDEKFKYDKLERLYSLKDRSSNKLMYGNSLKILKNIPTDSVDSCITDPPYNISGYDFKKNIGWLSSNNYWKEKKFDKIDEEWDKYSDNNYKVFTEQWLNEIKRIVKPNGNIAIFGSYHNIYQIGSILEALDMRINNSLVWYKRNAFPNITQRMFCESTEHIIWAVNNSKKDAKNWIFNYNDMKKINGGKQMRNMFDIPMTPKSEKKHGKYPAQKPEKLISYLIQALSNENDIIIDPFVGSGTTAVVAKNLSRRYIGIDNNIEAIKISKLRLKDNTNKQTILFSDD